MLRCFLASAQTEEDCAETLRKGLETQGYQVWRRPASLDLNSILYPSTIENEILACATFVLLWSQAATQNEWVERQLLFAQKMKKSIIVLHLDATALPTTLVATSSIPVQKSCQDYLAQLLPLIPPVDSSDAFLALLARSTHQYIRERKAAIDEAAEMLQRGEHREELLALLEYLVKNDLIDGVREKARTVLEEETQTTPASINIAVDSRHIERVRCKNGHISTFDKREICSATIEIPRTLAQRAGKELDELRLHCTTCGVEITARVDCEVYR